MKKVFKKSVSVLLVVVTCFTMAPLQGLVGLDIGNLFVSTAKAAGSFEEVSFSAEDYIASIILNTNTQSCAMSDDGKSVASMTLDYYTQPQNISLSKSFTDVLENDVNFMASVAAWETLTFEPTDIYSEFMTKQGYYQTILFNILNVAVDYNIIPLIVKNTNDHIISTLKSIDELEIKVGDMLVNGETTFDLLNAEQQHQIIQKTAGRMTELEIRNQHLSNLSMIVKTCTNVTDFVEKAAQLSALTKLTEDVKAVIDELYTNCSFVDNMELKSSISELKTAMNNTLDNISTIGFEMLCTTGKLSMDIFLSQLWGETVSACLGSLGAGLLIGQVIGRGLSNILFSTDKAIEQFYTMQALVDIEILMCKTVESLGRKYIADQNLTNASNFLKSIDLLYNTYKLDLEYATDFAEIIYTKGLINKVNLFVSGKPDNLEKLNSIVNSARSSMALSLGMLTDIDNYCWYLETDYFEVFDIYYNWDSNEDITDKYVDKVRKLTVACPTDVDIYDGNDLVISIKNNSVELCMPGYICSVEEDVKHFLLKADKQLSIRITGTADGVMTYTVSEGDKTGFTRTMVFKDVELHQDCTYDAIIPEKILSATENYNLTSDTGRVIVATYDSIPPLQDNIVDVIVAEELFDGFPVEIINLVADTMFNMKSVVDLSAYDISTDDSVALFSAVAKYYPAEYSLIANSDFTYKIIVSPNLDRIMKIRFYYGDDANLDTYQKRVKDLNAEIKALVVKVEGMNDFEKALYIHDYIVLNSEYDLELLDYMEKNNFRLPGEIRSEKFTEYSILVNGTGVCGSYALAYRAVLNAAGMECLYLSSEQMNHAWNMVKIDDNWYHVDCCWDDPVPDTYGRAKREYFLRTDKEIMDLKHYSWTPGKYKANSDKYSDMPRNYDTKQKYDDGKWYYLKEDMLYWSDVYGENETEIASITASTIDVDNGKIYYAKDRYIYEYDTNTDESKIVYAVSNSDLGEKTSSAYVSNMYVNDDNLELYKRIYKNSKYITIFDTDELEKEKYASVRGVQFDLSEVNIEVFDTFKLKADILSDSVVTGLEVVWSSSDYNIATVNSSGVVVGKNVGQVTIIADCLGYTDSCVVNITGNGLAGTCGDNITWNFEPSTKTIFVEGSGMINDYSSSNIPWKNIKSEIENVIIGEGITSIGERAFEDCDNLISVTLPNGLTEIGDEAFLGCKELENIMIPESVTNIGLFAFQYCKSLKEMVIPKSVINIGAGAFWGCERITSIVIPKNVKYLDVYTFSECTSLKEIIVDDANKYYSSDDGVLFDKNKTVLMQYPLGNDRITYVIPDSVNTIGDWAFRDSVALTNVIMPDSVTYMGFQVFENCESLADVKISKGLSNISNGSFCACLSLKNIDIPIGVKSIESSAFAFCSSLKTINISSSVMSIDDFAFNECTSLECITVDSNNQSYSSDEYGVLFDKNKTSLLQYPAGSKNEQYIIPNSVTIVGEDAFSACEKLKKVTIPNSLKYLSEYMFSRCTDLKIIEISNSIIEIGGSAFGLCENLTNVIMPSNVSNLACDAFYGCSNLKKILVLNGDCYIESRAFDTESNVTLYSYSNSAVQAYAEENGFNFVAIDSVPHTHDYFLMDYADPTPVSDGYEYHECYCGEASYTTTLHYYGEETTTDPTCTIEGSKTQTCLNCSEVNVLETTPATGKHDYKLVSTVPGDCTTAPIHTYECSVCHDSYTKEGRIDDGHNYVETIVEPTCDEKGYTLATCSKCGETVIYDFTSPKGHEFVITRSEDYCEAHGTMEYSCKKCDYYEQIASDGSNLLTETITVDPTCTKSGSKTKICTLCKATISTELLNPLSHDYAEEFTVDKAATCTAEGSKSQHCTRCDAKRAVTVVEATGHQNTSVINVSEATCTNNGYTGDTYCSDCESVIANGTATDKLSHTESDWITDKASTCTAEGLKHIECTECSEVIKTEVIAKLSHEYTTVVTKANCENGGYTTYTCSSCSYSYTADNTPATGHNYVDGVCTACGESKIDNCSHMCHKSGFMGFIWKIVQFFWRLFKMNPMCDCGVKHW